MAAKTPVSILRESLGSLTLHIATFTTNDIDDADTWASGIPGIVGAWCNPTDDPTTQASNGIDLGISGSTITFYAGESNRTGIVFVLSRS